jgi:hypothetical protein
MKQRYKWTIIRDEYGVFHLTGHCWVEIGKQWSQDGRTLRWTYPDGPLESIKKHIGEIEKDEARRAPKPLFSEIDMKIDREEGEETNAQMEKEQKL